MIESKLYAYLGGAWVDISSSVLASPGLSYKGGMATNEETDRIAGQGSLNFVLKNNNEAYTPGSGTAHSDWKKGTPIKVEFTRVSTKVKFIGRVSSIKLSYEYNNYRASITALDWMYTASQLPLDIPALQANQRADQIINTILALSPIQPESTSIATGAATFPYAFHDNTVKTSAYAEVSKAALSEWGYVYVKQNGTFTFEAYNGRQSTQKQITVYSNTDEILLLESGDYLLLEDGDSLLLESANVLNAEADVLTGSEFEYGERIINRVVAQVFPYRVGTEEKLLYTNETNQQIPGNGSISFRIQFTDESSRQQIAAFTPSQKQYTLLHFDTPPEGITGIQDAAEPKIAGTTTRFTQAGGATWDTSIKKFGTASIALNGSSDYIYGLSQEKFNFRAGDFTVDWWEYRLSSASGAAAIARAYGGGFVSYIIGQSDGANLRFYATSNGSSWDIANAVDMGTIALNEWVHYAVTRSGNTFRTFKNGVQQGTATSSATVAASGSDFSIGRNGSYYFNGYLDEIRMIKGYAAWTANFSPASSEHKISGINWSAFTIPPQSGIETTEYTTITTSPGGVGVDVTASSITGNVGYLNFDIYAAPLQSLSPIAHIAEDSTSINAYGYFSKNIDMRLRQDIVFAKTVAEAIVAAEKNPRMVLNKVSMIANKSDRDTALFMDCDIGDLVRVTDSLSGYSELNYIQGASWQAVPGDNGTIVYFDWIVKEQ